MLGLAGAHRTGKTTLAKAISESIGIPFVNLSFSTEILKDMGLSSLDQINSIEQRLYYQLARMELTEKALTGWKEAFVTDRTPLDVAAYTMADFGQMMSDKQIETAHTIMADAHRITNQRFRGLVYVYPGIPYEAAPNKPLPNTAYQEHIHVLIGGLLSSTANRVPYWYLDRDHTDPEVRLEAVEGVYAELVQGAVVMSRVMTHH